MAKSKFFEGAENIAPRTTAAARSLIGKKVKYLTEADIDKTGRGYFFPRVGVVVDVHRNEIAIDHPGNFCISMSSLREMILLDHEPEAQAASESALDEPSSSSKKASHGPSE